jgi:hypothetical protein
MTTGKRSAGLALLAAGLLALGGWTPAFADNLSPDSPYSQPGQTATNQSGTPSGSQKATQADMDKYNSEFHNSFQNLMPDAPPPGYSSMMGKWVTTLYGFVEMDTMYDSSNSYNNWPFNGAPANAQTIQGGYAYGKETSLGQTLNHDYWGFDVNNSRIGFAISSPVYNGYKVRALLEMDFLASPGETQYGLGGGFGAGYITNPIFRIRHFFGDVTTPWYGNFLFGQYWSLFGWQPYNIYNSVQIAPAPGTLYGRFPQLRWYKIFHAGEGIMIEPAVAAMLPPEPSSGVPAFVEGLKLADSDMKGEMMIGNTGKGQFPASLGFSAIQTDYAGYFQNNYTPTSSTTSGKAYNGANQSYNSWTSSEAVDLILPIIPIHDGKPGNNLTLQAEYSWGQGDALAVSQSFLRNGTGRKLQLRRSDRIFLQPLGTGSRGRGGNPERRILRTSRHPDLQCRPPVLLSGRCPDFDFHRIRGGRCLQSPADGGYDGSREPGRRRLDKRPLQIPGTRYANDLCLRERLARFYAGGAGRARVRAV